MEDAHLLEVAQRITNQQKLQHLGLKILKIPEYNVDSALYNEREIHDAVHKVLKVWYQSQNNRQEAYRNLYTTLYSNGWKLLAGELKHWVEGTTEPSLLLETSKILYLFII